MNTSQFMDKQILDLMNHPPPKDGSSPKSNGQQSADPILPNYDFQPIRSVPSSSSSSPPSTTILIPPTAGSSSPPSTWTVSLDSRTGSSNLRSAGLTPEPHQVPTEPTGSCVSMSEIDRTVKKYVDTVLNALDGVNARLAQLESRTSHVETAVDGLRGILGDYNGSNEGKLRHFENILREVQAGVQVLRDKQEIVETQLHLSKFQPQNPPKPSSETQPQSPQAPPPQQLALPAPPAPQQIAPQSLPNAPPQYIPPPSQMPLQSAPPNAPPQYGAPPPSQMGPQSGAPNAPPSQYPPQMGPQSGAPNAPSQYGAPPSSQMAPPQQPSYNQPDPIHQPPNLPYHQPQSQQIGFQPQPPPSQYPPYQPDESNPNPNPNPYNQPPQTQTYPPHANPNNPFIPQQPPNLGPSPPSSSFYGPPPPQYDPYYSSGSPSYRSKPNSSSPFTPSNNPLPTAKVLPQANPINSQSSGSNNSNNGRVPLDDVVEKVAMMGFSREQVRATVKRLTENGQNVDLNVVLDKLMNDSDVIQPQKGWFNR